MGKTYFTSDTHFGHANIIRYCNRPFKSVEHMNENLITNWNEIVGRNDTVFHLGDFAFKSIGADEYLRHLDGTIYFVYGNHDQALRQWFKRNVSEHRHILEAETIVKVEGQSIVLGHYAMKVWKGNHRGVWQLYGHSHGSMPDDPHALQIDVGVDCHDYKPISFERIKELMSQKTFKPVDVHGDANAPKDEHES